jgi:hypothetical protein
MTSKSPEHLRVDRIGIKKDGSISGFGWGVGEKRTLLQREGETKGFKKAS